MQEVVKENVSTVEQLEIALESVSKPNNGDATTSKEYTNKLIDAAVDFLNSISSQEMRNVPTEVILTIIHNMLFTNDSALAAGINKYRKAFQEKTRPIKVEV